MNKDQLRKERLQWALARIEACADECRFGEVDVRAVRLRFGYTQRMFAAVFGFPVATLRHWERGNRRPAGTALVLLHVIKRNPGVVMTVVRMLRRDRNEKPAGPRPRRACRPG
jgi:DNA-binding transcriptional regulator YiaG